MTRIKPIANLHDCAQLCRDGHRICNETLVHCLAKGGELADLEHIRLLIDCAEICATSADFMSRGSDLHQFVCRACAQVCARCADLCDRLGDDEIMQRCADACLRCADSCYRMSADVA